MIDPARKFPPPDVLFRLCIAPNQCFQGVDPDIAAHKKSLSTGWLRLLSRYV
jgi:hypothetical protein